jgi:hypothetical protein
VLIFRTMKAIVELTEDDLKELVSSHLRGILGSLTYEKSLRVHILVKSKQNYKSEWEEAAFKATVEVLK